MARTQREWEEEAAWERQRDCRLAGQNAPRLLFRGPFASQRLHARSHHACHPRALFVKAPMSTAKATMPAIRGRFW